MTKRGSFKRIVRRRARRSGKRYTQVRAEMERDQLNARIWTRVDHDPLRAHLEERYGIRIAGLTPFDTDHPGTFRVNRHDGAPWVARVFSSSVRPMDRVEGDAEILRFLHGHGYPAERCAHAEPVSVHDGRGVLVTEFVEGATPGGNAATQRTLADLLGRLHALPAASGAMARDGGSFDHDPVHEGRPSQDLAAAMNFLHVVEDGVAREHRGRYNELREQVEQADACDGLPEALTHSNLIPDRVVDTGDELVVLAWAGAGRGPRLAALAFLLWGAGLKPGGDTEKIDAIVDGYRTHIRPTDEELERLAGALMIRPLYFASWYYWRSITTGYQPTGIEGWWPDADLAGAIAAKARAAFTR